MTQEEELKTKKGFRTYKSVHGHYPKYSLMKFAASGGLFISKEKYQQMINDLEHEKETNNMPDW